MKILLIPLSLAVWTIAACAADSEMSSPGQLSKHDYQFAQEAAQGGRFEVEAGKLARDKATDPKVKEFGQRMITDHGKAGEELKGLAMKKNAMLPSDLGETHQQHLEHLRNLSGKEFDDAYVAEMLSDHKKDLKAFQKQAKSGDDADLKAFASQTATVIAEHLQMVTDLSKK